MRASAALGVLLSLILQTPSVLANSIIAHRGVYQNFDTRDLAPDTCTATRIFPPEHQYLENTLASMQAAFAAGASWVELDIHPTKDKHFVVFHDWTLECRTNGSGVTRERDLAYLKSLDIGYGYSADGGKTFPFRGKAQGLMPSLKEVIDAFPEGKFLINIKSRDPAEAKLLIAFLDPLTIRQRENLAVYTSSESLVKDLTLSGSVRVWPTKSTIASCYKTLITSQGRDLGPCKGRDFAGPIYLAEKIKGWPQAFIALVHKHGGEFYAHGIDSEQAFKRLGKTYKGGIWTDRIEVIGPLVQAENENKLSVSQ